MKIAIAGAGLMGRMIGHRLTALGFDVALFERDARGEHFTGAASSGSGAAYVAAAMLAPVSELPESDETIFDMGKQSLNLWPELLTELDVPYSITGSLVVAHGSDAPLLDKFHRSLGRHAETEAQWLTGRELGELEGDLGSRFGRGLFLPNEGWIDNRALLNALETRCGTIHYATPVENLTALGGDLAIDCRGVGSDDPQLRAVRGEVVRVRAPEVSLSRPVRVMHPRYQVYVAPRPGNEYVIGATQIESAFTGGVAVRSALELLSAAFALHPGFAEAEILELSSGLRPAYPDHLPKVYWRDDGVLSVNGLFRHGYLIAPAIVRCVLEEIETSCASISTANPSNSKKTASPTY